MTTRAEVRVDLQDLINNSLCSDALADKFIDRAARRLSRLLKIRELETLLTVTVDETYPGSISIPDDFSQLIEIRIDVGDEEYRLERQSSDQALRFLNTNAYSQSKPRVFFRQEDAWYLLPSPREGDVIKVLYRADLVVPATDDGTNSAYDALPDLLLYHALVFAGDHFVDERKQMWKETGLELLAEIDGQAREDDLAGLDLRIRNPYEGGY